MLKTPEGAIMRNLIILCMLFMFAMPAMAKLYKCKDADGNTIYTDEQCADGKQLKLPPIQTYTPRKLPSATTSSTSSKSNKKQKKAEDYESLEINKPADDSVIRDNTGVVDISYTLTPALKLAKAHKFAIVIDGKQLKTKGTTSRIKLSDMDRGTHIIQINVVDDKDKVLISSKPTSFHMKRESILHPKPQAAPK